MKQALILIVAVIVALATAKGLVTYVDARAVARPVSGSALASVVPGSVLARSRIGRLRKSADGHYWAWTEIDGRSIRCLVDTGATAVALTRADAASLGFDPVTLDYDLAVTTAAGRSRAARVELDRVSVAGVQIDHVQAMVVRSGLPSSLLGMTYLGRLSRFEATPAMLVLQP